jgi:uncharacterized protein
MALLLRIVVIVALGYVMISLLAFLLQSRLVHLPNVAGRALVASPAGVGMRFEDVHLNTSDGVRLHGWYVPAKEARGTILFLHGNAGNISHRLESIRLFHELDLNLLIIDYRGYGESEGRPSEEGLYRDAEAAYEHLIRQRGVEPAQLVVFGRSLGAAVAARTAATHPVGGLVVESAFTSVPDIGAELYPFLPVRLLARLQYDTRAHVAEVAAPTLVVHSTDDEIIPYRHGEAIYAAARNPAGMLTIRGDHNAGFILSGDAYRRGLATFLRDVLGDGATSGEDNVLSP